MTDYFATLLAKIADHPTYGPAMAAAAESGRPLVLNYHSHGDPGSWCVSISAPKREASRLLQIDPELEELVHVRGVGKSAEECIPFCAAFAAVLQQRYRLAQPPRALLNGRPVGGDPADAAGG